MTTSDYQRYTGNGVFWTDPALIREAAGISRAVRMGRKGWLLGSTAHYTRLFAQSKGHS